MSASVLVATPHLAFGELLRLSLEEEERFRVRLVRTAREAAAIASHPACQVAILDAELQDMPIAELVSQLLARLPQLKIVLIPPDNDINHPDLSGMDYHGHILRPFYLPDLMALMETLTADFQPDEPVPSPGKPDPEAFERAVAASSATAGVLLFGQDESLVSGAVPPAVADELKIWFNAPGSRKPANSPTLSASSACPVKPAITFFISPQLKGEGRSAWLIRSGRRSAACACRLRR